MSGENVNITPPVSREVPTLVPVARNDKEDGRPREQHPPRPPVRESDPEGQDVDGVREIHVSDDHIDMLA